MVRNVCALLRPVNDGGSSHPLLVREKKFFTPPQGLPGHSA